MSQWEFKQPMLTMPPKFIPSYPRNHNNFIHNHSLYSYSSLIGNIVVVTRVELTEKSTFLVIFCVFVTRFEDLIKDALLYCVILHRK